MAVLRPDARVQVPHLDSPLRIVPCLCQGTPAAHTQFAVVEQDSIEDIEACVINILRYPKGYRIEEPEFGIEPQEFRMNGADINHIREQILAWEPRVAVLADEEFEGMMSRVMLQIGARDG